MQIGGRLATQARAKGPFVAPADVLLTEGKYRSKQAATEQDPFSAVYAAQVPFTKPGKYVLYCSQHSDMGMTLVVKKR